MSETNPNNYQGATVTIVGYAAGEAKPPAYDKEGTKGVLQLSIPISEGFKDKNTGEWVEKSTTWYSYSAAGEYAETLKTVRKGDKVRIEDAKQEVREYTSKDGTGKLGIELRFGTLVILESKGAPAADSAGFSDEAPF